MNPAARDSAPYGKACAGCSKAKCRCIPRGAGLPCERCYRLRRECQPSRVVRKGPQRPARAPSAAQLGEKLDSLAALLRSQAEGRGDSDRTGSSSGGSRVEPRALREQRQHQQGQGTETARESPEASSAYYPTPQTTASPLPHEPSPSQAEQHLDTFRRNHLRMFPFIYIHPDTAATQLQRERPFLWLNIRASCTKSLQEQVALEQQIRQVAAQKLLVDLEQNMDLLLGLIVFLSWAGEKFRGKPVLGVFSSLTAALLSDLRLDRNVQELSTREINVCRAHGFPVKVGPGVGRTSEERRAALGCYVVTTSLSCFLKIPTTVKWTPYMDECVRHLSQYADAPGDAVLVTTARTFRMMDDLIAVVPSRLSDLDTRQLPLPPPMLLIKALRANLEDLRKTTSQVTLENKVVMLHLLFTEAMINEIPLYPAEPSATASRCVDFGKTECFHTCLTALTQFLSTWLTLTPTDVAGLPMPLHMLSHRCTHMLYRLALADDPAWDRAVVLGSVDLLAAAERCADLYSAVPGAVGLETDGADMYSRSAGVLRATVPIWRKALEEAGVRGGGVEGVDTGELLELPGMDLAFDGWFSDSFAPFNVF